VEEERPIIVNSNAAPGQLMAALRTFLVAVATWAAARGWIDAQVGMAGAGLLVIAAPALWQQYVAKQKHDQLKTLAAAAPDSVGQVK
jgi:uncharacterized membrane protein